jgi:hypothetical protein
MGPLALLCTMRGPVGVSLPPAVAASGTQILRFCSDSADTMSCARLVESVVFFLLPHFVWHCVSAAFVDVQVRCDVSRLI